MLLSGDGSNSNDFRFDAPDEQFIYLDSFRVNGNVFGERARQDISFSRSEQGLLFSAIRGGTGGELGGELGISVYAV